MSRTKKLTATQLRAVLDAYTAYLVGERDGERKAADNHPDVAQSRKHEGREYGYRFALYALHEFTGGEFGQSLTEQDTAQGGGA